MRSCKRVFYAINGTYKLTDEVLSTTFCLVEPGKNACPVIPAAPDVTEMEALMPYHFLMGENSVSCPSLLLDEIFDLGKRYVRSQAYAIAIWQRWLKEYVPSLNKRSKWHAVSSSVLRTGDLVWIVDLSSPRGHYPLFE